MVNNRQPGVEDYTFNDLKNKNNKRYIMHKVRERQKFLKRCRNHKSSTDTIYNCLKKQTNKTNPR